MLSLNVPPQASPFFSDLAIFFISIPLSNPETSVTIFPYLFLSVVILILWAPLTICSQTHACFGKPHFGQISIYFFLPILFTVSKRGINLLTGRPRGPVAGRPPGLA